MNFVRFPFIVMALVIAAASFSAISAGDKVAPINTNWRGIALHGYDPVTYFESTQPAEGSSDFVFTADGATWRFVSAANEKKFEQNREKYMPQFGGYCAKAVSENTTADVDPLAYKIVNGKLYLNYDKKIQKLWEQDIPGRIANAEKYWPDLHRSK